MFLDDISKYFNKTYADIENQTIRGCVMLFLNLIYYYPRITSWKFRLYLTRSKLYYYISFHTDSSF